MLNRNAHKGPYNDQHVGYVIPGKSDRRRNTCSSNQHDLFVGFQQYETAKKRLAGYRNSFGPHNSGNRLAVPLSWAVVILPYVGREDLWRDYGRRDPDPANPPPRVEVPEFLCPSAQRDAGLSYVANCGLPDPALQSPLNPNNPPETAATAVFLDRLPVRPKWRRLPWWSRARTKVA